MILPAFTISVCGDSALIVAFAGDDTELSNRAARWLEARLDGAEIAAVTECFVTVCELNVIYNPTQITYHALSVKIEKLIKKGTVKKAVRETEKQYIHCVPVCYGGEYGPDLCALCEKKGTDIKAYTELHSNNDYLIYAITEPGAALLSPLRAGCEAAAGELSRAPENSVVVEDDRTYIMPASGNTRGAVIGRAAVSLFRPGESMPTQPKAGDFIRFIPVTENKFKKLAEKGVYEIKPYKACKEPQENG